MWLYSYYISAVANNVTLQLFLYVVYNINLKSNIYSLLVSPPPPNEDPGAHLITVTQTYKQPSRDLPSRSHSSTQARYGSLSGQIEHPKSISWIVLPE